MATASLNGSDYFYPGTTILVNKAGIKDQTKLDTFEREATALRLEEQQKKPVKGDYGLDHLQAIHKQTFKDVYSWAGELRSVNIAKGPASDRTFFTDVDRFKIDASNIQQSIKDSNNLRGMNRDEFSSKMGELFKQVNTLHPFREGNGRVTREYFGQLAKDAGYNLDFSSVNRQEWNNAAKLSDRGQLQPIQAIFREISTPQRAITFDTENNHVALGKHPELDGAYKKLYEAKLSGKDITEEKKILSKELHAGRIIDGGITPGESLKVITHAAKTHGLTTQQPGELGTKHSGTVVAKSSHHVLLQTNTNTAILYDRKMLAENLQVGEKLTLQHQENKLVKSREISESRDLERNTSIQQRG